MVNLSELYPRSNEPASDHDGDARRFDLGVTSLTGAKIAIFVGTVVLIGWALRIHILTTFLPGPRATQPVTAACLVLAGYGLVALQQSRPWRISASAALALVILISLHALLKHITGADLGMDNPLFPQAVLDQPQAYTYPGRPSAPTATAFLLVAVTACFQRVNARPAGRVYSTFATVALGFIVMAMLSHLFRVEQLTGLLGFSQLGIPTAIGLCGLSVTLLALRPDAGWVRQLVSGSVGASAARWLLPAIVVLPVAVAWVAYQGHLKGLYSFAFSLSLTTLVTVGLLVAFTLRLASQLDKLAAARDNLLHAQEGERRRIARDLHDSALQQLVSLQFDIMQLKPKVNDPAAGKLLSHCSASVREIQDEIRTMAFINHPPSLAAEGIGTALAKLAAGFAKRSGLKVESSIGEIGGTCRSIEATLYRVAQEALTNVHRHSRATKVKLGLEATDDRIDLTIEDDGVGFEQDALARSAPLGVGVLGMIERVRELGGSLSIHKLPKGTSVTASLPYTA
jgi:signal transduction histidine kinase